MALYKSYCVIARPIYYGLGGMKTRTDKTHVAETCFESESECLQWIEEVHDKYDKANYILSIGTYYSKVIPD